MFVLSSEALKPARQAQWNWDPVLIHEVVMSQKFWPEIGLQVPHTGDWRGVASDRGRAEVRPRRAEVNRAREAVECMVTVTRLGRLEWEKQLEH